MNNLELEDLSKHLNVNRIVWVDDIFDSPNKEDIIQKLIPHLQTLRDLENWDCLKYINVNDIKDIDSEQDLASALNKYSKIELTDELTNFEVGELESSSKDALLKALRKISKTDTATFSNWKSILGNDSIANTLMLLDMENGDIDPHAGIDVAQSLFTSDVSPTVIFFTHSCKPNEEEEKRKEIYQQFIDDKLNVKPHKYIVFSKSRIDEIENIETDLRDRIKNIYSRKIFSQMAEKLDDKIKSKINDFLFALGSESIYNIEKSMFISAFTEGTSEIGVLHRLFNLIQSDAAEEIIIEDDEFSSLIKKLRLLRNESESQNLDFSNSLLLDLREKEFVISSELINKTHSPLSNGDIFTIDNHKYIYICQACDNTIRQDGTRSVSTGVLVYFKECTKKKGEPNSLLIKKSEIKNQTKSLKFYFAGSQSFQKPKLVNLNVLDLCVFNEDGKCEINKEQKCPEIILPGWEERFNVFQSLIKDTTEQNIPEPLKYINAGFKLEKCEDDGVKYNNVAIKYDAENQLLTTDIKRTGRLRSEYADYIFNQYISHTRRKAFDHQIFK